MRQLYLLPICDPNRAIHNKNCKHACTTSIYVCEPSGQLNRFKANRRNSPDSRHWKALHIIAYARLINCCHTGKAVALSQYPSIGSYDRMALETCNYAESALTKFGIDTFFYRNTPRLNNILIMFPCPRDLFPLSIHIPPYVFVPVAFFHRHPLSKSLLIAETA